MYIGDKVSKIKFEPNKIYKLEHQDVQVKAGRDAKPIEWFCNEMFDLNEEQLVGLSNIKDSSNLSFITFRIMDHFTTKMLDPEFPKPITSRGFESKSTFAKFHVPTKYLLRDKMKAQGNFIAEIVDAKDKSVIGRVFINLGSYSYPIAKKTTVPHKYKKRIMAEMREKKVRIQV